MADGQVMNETNSMALHNQKGVFLRAWQTELLFAIPAVALVFHLFYRWFAVLDRYFIFLYFHDMGPGFDTTPFGPVTSSRYWMAGLVAAGTVMVPYVTINLVLGRLFKSFRAPVWWRLWLLCAIPLLIAIPALVMTVNDPGLPLSNAVQVTLATLVGLALALLPGRMAAEKPRTLVWLMVDGLAPAILLLSLIRIDSVSDWLARERVSLVVYMIILCLIGLALLVVTTAFCWWLRIHPPDAATWLAAGFSIAYLLLPLCHYLFAGGSNGAIHFAYITDSANFFVHNGLAQIGIWGAVGLFALGLTRLRKWLVRRRTT